MVWLGPADATSADALTMLDELGTQVSGSDDYTMRVQGPSFDDSLRLQRAL